VTIQVFAIHLLICYTMRSWEKTAVAVLVMGIRCDAFSLSGRFVKLAVLNVKGADETWYGLEHPRICTHRLRKRALLKMSTDDENQSIPTGGQSAMVLPISMLLIPVASGLLPGLLQLARSFPPNSSEQFAAVTALFVTNRAYLYWMAATIVALAGMRGSKDTLQLGSRVTDLTEELLYRPALDKNTREKRSEAADGSIDQEPIEKPSLIRSLTDSGLEESLDQISSETQALILPLLVSFLLALSIFLLPFWSGAPSIPDDGISPFNSDIRDLLSKILPTISQVWNVGLLALFTRSEVRRLGFELKYIPDSPVFEWVAAVSITGLACFAQLWPAQNFVNMSLAILVARAIQLDSFKAVVGALGLLTLYDVSSVLLIPAAGASEILVGHSDILASSSMELASESAASASAMGSVAIQKLTSGTFQPGLLVTKVGNSLGGGLGLGDAVFPSLLANFVKRFDESRNAQDDRLSLFAVSMVGYLLGCFACEFAPLISTSGLPALVFIVPFMLGSVVLASAISGELEELVGFDPKNEEI
jgi:hypothetical protein